MKFKKLIILIGIVILLLLLVSIKSCLQKSRLAVINKRDNNAVILVPGFPGAFASKITIYRGENKNDKIIFVRQNNGQWIIETKFGVKARQDIVDNLLNNINDLRGELMGESRSLYRDFEILDNQAANILLEGNKGNSLVHLAVSFKKPAFNRYFVRLAGSEKVILTDRDILSAAGIFDKTTPLNANLFADNKVFSFDPNSVNRIELKDSRKQTLILVRGELSKKNPEGIWKFETDKPKSPKLEPAKIKEFLQNAATIRFLDSLDPKLAIYGFDRPFMEAALDMAKDSKPSQIRILVGAHLKEKGTYYVQVMPQNQVFAISEPFINNLNHDKTYFSVQQNKGKKK